MVLIMFRPDGRGGIQGIVLDSFYVDADGNVANEFYVVSDATVKAASFETSHALRIGLELLDVAYKRGIPLCPIATDLHLEALAALAKGNESKALEILRVDDAHIPEDGGFVSSNGLNRCGLLHRSDGTTRSTRRHLLWVMLSGRQRQ